MPAYQPRIAALVTEAVSELRGRLAEVEDLGQLEHGVRKVGLDIARGLAELVLEILDGLLAGQRPPGWRVKDVRPRTLESTVGTLHLKRRRYRDAEGRWRYPLDEALKLARQVQVTPELQRYASEHRVSIDAAVAAGMSEKSAEFVASGGAVYLPVTTRSG